MFTMIVYKTYPESAGINNWKLIPEYKGVGCVEPKEYLLSDVVKMQKSGTNQMPQNLANSRVIRLCNKIL